MKRFFGALLAVVVLFGSSARAADGERITLFHSDITLGKDGVAHIQETISYDFGYNQRHGIYRYVPTELVDDQKNSYRSTFTAGAVTIDGGQAVPSDVSSTTSKVTIKIGDAAHTITGVHTYEISYTLAPLVRHGSGLDRFPLNITGNGWEVPIDEVSATLKLGTADGLVSTAQRCYTGNYGSTTQDCVKNLAESSSAGTYSFKTSGQLAAGEGLSIEADFAEGSFASYLEPYKAPPISPLVYLAGALYGLFAIGVVTWPLYQRYRAYRAKKDQVVIAQYEAPDGLTPAELGLLLDNKANMTEVTATLIDLAVRGYIKIVQTSPKTIFSPAKYRFMRLKDSDDTLAGYEISLLGALFKRGASFGGLVGLIGSALKADDHTELVAGAKESIDLSEIDNDNMASVVTGIKKNLKTSLEQKGYFKTGSFPFVWMILYILVCLPLLIIPPLAFVLIALGVASAFTTKLSSEGLGEWAKVSGFKLFLSVTEADRLKFTDAPAKTPELFSKLLPAAVALGVEKEWGKQFEGMDIARSTDWYSGQGAFTAMALTNDLGTGFSSAISSGFAPTQTSSSSGGGGFSGGGGGGGGGGSW